MFFFKVRHGILPLLPCPVDHLLSWGKINNDVEKVRKIPLIERYLSWSSTMQLVAVTEPTHQKTQVVTQVSCCVIYIILYSMTRTTTPIITQTNPPKPLFPCKDPTDLGLKDSRHPFQIETWDPWLQHTSSICHPSFAMIGVPWTRGTDCFPGTASVVTPESRLMKWPWAILSPSRHCWRRWPPTWFDRIYSLMPVEPQGQPFLNDWMVVSSCFNWMMNQIFI